MLDTLASTPLTVARLLGPDPEAMPVAVGSGDHHELAELVRPSWQRPEDTQAVAALDDRLLIGLLRPARVHPLVQHLTNRPAQPEPEVNHFPRPPALPLRCCRLDLTHAVIIEFQFPELQHQPAKTRIAQHLSPA